MNRLLVAFVLAGGLVAAAWMQPAMAVGPGGAVDTAIGPVIANENGRTLYTYDKDSTGRSTCNAQCAVNWPPYVAAEDAEDTGDWTIIAREDGQKQWAYKGMPVYTWSKDQQRGDATGHGKNESWRALKP